MGAPEHQHGPGFRQPTEPDHGQVTRLEQQVSYNYSMLTGHHRDIEQLSASVARMSHEMGQVIAVVEELRRDFLSGRLPPKALDPGRYDPADVEVLAAQIANVTSKANEVDNLKVQIELMKQRLKRFESQSMNATPGPPTEGVPSRPDQHFEAIRAQQAQQAQQPPGHPLSLNRPGAALSSEHARAAGHPPAPVLESQPAANFHPTHERQPNAIEQAQQVARQPGFRPAEPLPGPGSLSNWRPADFPPSGGPQPAHGHPLRSHPPEPEAPVVSGWSAVNQAPKRSLDEHHPHHDSQPGSPKRPKLAPLKPRSSFGDEQHQSPYAQAAHIDAAHQARGRISSGDVSMQPQTHPAPPPGPTTNSYRFITSTGQPDGPEQWRPAEGDPNISARFEHTPGTSRGRGRGSRGGRRGGRGRGGRSSSGAADHPPVVQEAPPPEHVHSVQVPPEWREHQWAATQQATSNGHYPGQHAYSPIDGVRAALPDMALHTGAPSHGLPFPAGHEHEFPATPVASNTDPYALAAELDSANKKTRTKPIRNSDGVLIRKDGRPDMRSVSSANNLRKVHAKKEAEKAEMEGRTPTSGRSLAPAERSSLSDDEGGDEGDYMDVDGDMEREHDSEGRRTGTPGTQHEAESERIAQHRELMSRMFHEHGGPPKDTAEQWFPRVEGPPLGMKREEHDNKEREARWRGMEDPTAVAQPEVEREVSQRPSEQVSREQTSIEGTPINTRASEPAASEQPGAEGDIAAAKISKPAATVEKEVAEMGKKDSTQLESTNGSERVASEPQPTASETAA